MKVWDILGQKKCATFTGNAYHNNYDHEKLTYSKSQNNIIA